MIESAEVVVTNHVHFDLAPPRSWSHFEELCADTFQEEWQDSMLVRHGRAGQSQYGVDIVGRNGAIWPVGIQCKRKSAWPVSKITTHDLDAEVEKAKEFKPPLKAFYLVSTAPDDRLLQEHARSITERHQTDGLFSVAVIGWNELVRRATLHSNVAAKHFGAYSTGPASPLLAIWRASKGELQMEDDELGIAIQELIHDLRDCPAGRIVFRQNESEDLLLQIKQLQTETQSLDERRNILELRGKLKILKDQENAVVDGLMLLLGHKVLRELLAFVWGDQAPLLIRSFVEQGIDPHLSNVTGLEKIRLHSPGYIHSTQFGVFMPSPDILTIMDHQKDFRERYPNPPTNCISELPDNVQFRHAVPAVMRAIVSKTQEGASLQELESSGWLDMTKWKFTF